MNCIKVFLSDRRLGFCKYLNYILHIEYFLNKNGYSGIYSIDDGLNYYFDSKDHLIKNYLPYFFDQIIENEFVDEQLLTVNKLEEIGYSISHTLPINILKKTFNRKFNIKKNILTDALKLKESFNLDKTLGLLLRGTNYSKKLTSFRNEYFLSKAIQNVFKLMNIYKLETIFLLTEDEQILSAFKKVFNDKIYSCNQFIVNTEGPLFDYKLKSKQIIELYQKYLRNIIMLSKMKYIITSTTNASILINILRCEQPIFSYMIH